jgi:hypothetical protein
MFEREAREPLFFLHLLVVLTQVYYLYSSDRSPNSSQCDSNITTYLTLPSRSEFTLSRLSTLTKHHPSNRNGKQELRVQERTNENELGDMITTDDLRECFMNAKIIGDLYVMQTGVTRAWTFIANEVRGRHVDAVPINVFSKSQCEYWHSKDPCNNQDRAKAEQAFVYVVFECVVR